MVCTEFERGQGVLRSEFARTSVSDPAGKNHGFRQGQLKGLNFALGSRILLGASARPKVKRWRVYTASESITQTH